MASNNTELEKEKIFTTYYYCISTCVVVGKILAVNRKCVENSKVSHILEIKSKNLIKY